VLADVAWTYRILIRDNAGGLTGSYTLELDKALSGTGAGASSPNGEALRPPIARPSDRSGTDRRVAA
jgi:hypothetical protein